MALNITGLATFAAGIEEAIAKGVEDTADQIVDTAQSIVPVRTGALRDSIHAEPTGDPDAWRVIAGSDDVEYAPFVEYGTSRMAAQPFLTPAVEQHRGDLEANIERRLKELASRSQV